MSHEHSANRYLLETAKDRLEFDRTTGKLVSFRSKLIPHQELLEVGKNDPVFVIQYLNAERDFCQLTSQKALEINVKFEYHSIEKTRSGELIATFRNLNGLNIDATIKVHASSNDRFSYWSLTLTNESGLLITDVQFPFIVVPYKLGGTSGTETL